MFAYKHDDVLLPCHVIPTTATNITWLKRSHGQRYNANGGILQNVRHRISINNPAVGDYSLKIEDVQLSDDGDYECFDQQQLLAYVLLYIG